MPKEDIPGDLVVPQIAHYYIGYLQEYTVSNILPGSHLVIFNYNRITLPTSCFLYKNKCILRMNGYYIK